MNRARTVFPLCLLLASLACITLLPRPTPPVGPITPGLPTLVPTLTPREDTETILSRLGGDPCPDSEFTCVTLTVPLDHFNPDSAGTIQVVFGVLPASGERRGMFVTATGGPGTAGLTSADSYTEAFDPRIPEHFDIIFFDQRGAGQSGGLQCASAAAAYYQTEVDTATPEGEAAAAAAAEKFAADCVREMGPTDLLPYLATRQAVEDLESFRQAMGDEKFYLYGESYGTQFAQTYAAAHPDRLAGLILDGTVDLSLSGADYLREQAGAFNAVLVQTLNDCNAQPDCAADMGGNAVAAYDDLAARLDRSPIAVAFPLPAGGSASRILTLADLETTAANNLYAEDTRMLFLRALAAAGKDFVPLVRLTYDALGLDPETLVAIPDPTYSDAVYYAVECRDYAYFSGTPDERATAYLRAGDAVDGSIPRFASIFYGDLPCAFWPTTATDLNRPAPLVADGIPTLVLIGTADPATPLANSQRVLPRLADGYLVTMDGGPHVIFGRGDACPDDLVTAFLVDGELPPRETRCDGVVADEYVPLAPADALDFSDPLEALLSADDEIYYLPEYYNWDGETPTSVGCPRGGTLRFTTSSVGERFRLDDCAFTARFELTGTGEYDYDADRFTLDVAVTGLAEGNLHYTRASDGSLRAKGIYAGETVDLSR